MSQTTKIVVKSITVNIGCPPPLPTPTPTDDGATLERVCKELIGHSGDLVRQHWDDLPVGLRAAYTKMGNIVGA